MAWVGSANPQGLLSLGPGTAVPGLKLLSYAAAHFSFMKRKPCV